MQSDAKQCKTMQINANKYAKQYKSKQRDVIKCKTIRDKQTQNKAIQTHATQCKTQR